MARLDEGAVCAIRLARARGVRLKELAMQYGVSISAVWSVAKGLTWRHVQ